MAFTHGDVNSQAEDNHELVMRIAGETRHIVLPELHHGSFDRYEGDFWKFNLTDFYFTHSCIRLGNIESIALKERGNDGWRIDSIVTFFKAGSSYQLATMDINANRWVDGDGSPNGRRFELNLII